MKENKKDLAKLAIGGVATLTVVNLFTASCLVFSACVVIATLIAAYVAMNLVNGEKLTKKGLVTMIIIVVALVCVGTYHKYFCHLDNNIEEVVETSENEETTEETEEKPEEVVETEETKTLLQTELTEVIAQNLKRSRQLLKVLKMHLKENLK